MFIKILTLNTRGLCDMRKCLWFGFEILRNCDIIGLSETKLSEKHLQTDKINVKSMYERYFGFITNWNYSLSSSRSSGTAILHTNKLNKYFKSIVRDKNGRAIMIRFIFNNISLRIIQIYCKTNQVNLQSCTEVVKFNDLILEWVNDGIKNNERIIVMGDQNAVFNPCLDRKYKNKRSKNNPESILIKKLIDEIKLIDVFVTDNIEMTYKSISRIDYILVDKKLTNSIHDKGIIKTDELNKYTDHAALYLELNLSFDT